MALYGDTESSMRERNMRKEGGWRGRKEGRRKESRSKEGGRKEGRRKEGGRGMKFSASSINKSIH